MGNQLPKKINTPTEGYQELCRRIIHFAEYDIKRHNKHYEDAKHFMRSDWGEAISWFANADLSKPMTYSTHGLRSAIQNKNPGE